MTNPSHTDLAARLRETAQSIRRKPMPLADFIPLLQQAADALESPERVQGEAELAGWLYDWTHSSALGKPDEEFTSFTTDEAYARGHRNARAVYTAPTPPKAPAQDAQGARKIKAHMALVQTYASAWKHDPGGTADEEWAAVEASACSLSATPSPQAEKQPLSLDEIRAWAVRRMSALGPEGVTDPVAFLEEGVRWGETQHGIVTKEST